MFWSTQVSQLSVIPFHNVTPANREYTIPDLSHFFKEIISFAIITNKTEEGLLLTNV
jgi:hypothetical protein